MYLPTWHCLKQSRAADQSSNSNGQLRAEINGAISRAQFKQRLLEALKDPGRTPPTSSTDTNLHTTSNETIQPARLPSTGNVIPSSSSAVQSLLDERRRRLEIDKSSKDAAERAERKAKAEARHAEAERAAPDSAKAKQVSYAQQQRKRQQEAREERERILKVIENDKIERRHKEELRKALAKAEAEGNDGADGLVDRQLSSEVSRPRPTLSVECAIQVRLFDGSIIRSRFPSKQTLRTDVRRWVDDQRSDGDSPYTFKQILAPMPNRPITISEEDESLQSLRLTPSATLVMVPVQGYTAAYATPGFVSRGLLTGYSAVSGAVGTVTGTLGTYLGIGQAAIPAETAATGHSLQRPSSLGSNNSRHGINVRTLRDQRENRDNQQLYNGNQVSLTLCKPTDHVANDQQLNFEPRKDDTDKED